MSKIISVSQVRADIYNVVDETAQTHEPILITGYLTFGNAKPTFIMRIKVACHLL